MYVLDYSSFPIILHLPPPIIADKLMYTAFAEDELTGNAVEYECA